MSKTASAEKIPANHFHILLCSHKAEEGPAEHIPIAKMSLRLCTELTSAPSILLALGAAGEQRALPSHLYLVPT